MDFVSELLRRVHIPKEAKSYDLVLSYWFITHQEIYLNLHNYKRRPLICQVKVIKAFYKDVLEEIMDDRFKMFYKILKNFYQKRTVKRLF